MSDDQSPTPVTSVDALLAGFADPIAPTPISIVYRIGLLVVALAMVLLPVAYAALIVVAAYGVQWHARNDAWLLTESGLGLARALAYFGPIVAGAILIFFMVKPFFARSSKVAERVVLDADRERVLFALIRRLSTIIGAPMPVRVQVDCSVNASASLVGGAFSLFHRDLVLTIGLPLAAGLTMQQLAGVLAHELGHFAQNAGMRLTYAIRTINQWLWRVVNERDEWDVWLETSARSADWRIGIVLSLASGAVSLTRRMLWALMMCGHGISCFMLRQMEYDADSYEIKISGSEAFGDTMARLRALNIAAQLGYRDMHQSWVSGRLPNDIAALVASKCGDLPGKLAGPLPEAPAKQKLFDTHPSDDDRIESARQMHARGIFDQRGPASELFCDFRELSRTVTHHHYENDLGLNLEGIQLIDTTETIDESRKAAAALQALGRTFGDRVLMTRPIVIDSDVMSCAIGPVCAPDDLTAAPLAVSDGASAAMDATNRFADLEERKERAMIGRQLIEAGYGLGGEDFGFSETTTASADARLAQICREQDALTNVLAAYERTIGRRLASASQIAHSSASYAPTDGNGASHGSRMIGALAMLNGLYGTVLQLRQRIVVFDAVVSYARARPRPERLNRYVYEFEDVVRKLVARLRDKAADAPYPFARAGTAMTLVDYLRGRDVTTEDINAVLHDARAHVDLFFELYWRIVGELALIAEHVAAARSGSGR